MVSAFQSRECGFGLNLTSDQLEQINFERRGKKYFDEVAAKEMKGSVFKQESKTHLLFVILNLVTKITGIMI